MKKLLLVLALSAMPFIACAENENEYAGDADDKFFSEAIYTEDFDAIDEAVAQDEEKDEKLLEILRVLRLLEESERTWLIFSCKNEGNDEKED